VKVRAEIKKSVEAYRGQPGQIVADKLVKCPVEVRAAMGNRENLKKMIQRQKRGNALNDPKTTSDIPSSLPEEYTHIGVHPFLVNDNNGDSDRVLIFSSEIGLSLLSEANVCFVEGTHSTAPKQFTQMFVVRVPLGNTHVSAVYGLLPSKTHSVYEEFLTAVLDVCLGRNLRPDPTTVVADFEIGIHNAVRSVLRQDIHIQGCVYHLTQSTWRRLQAGGLQAVYREDDDVRTFVGMLDGLAFLPVDRVTEGMAVL